MNALVKYCPYLLAGFAVEGLLVLIIFNFPPDPPLDLYDILIFTSQFPGLFLGKAVRSGLPFMMITQALFFSWLIYFGHSRISSQRVKHRL